MFTQTQFGKSSHLVPTRGVIESQRVTLNVRLAFGCLGGKGGGLEHDLCIYESSSLTQTPHLTSFPIDFSLLCPGVGGGDLGFETLPSRLTTPVKRLESYHLLISVKL